MTVGDEVVDRCKDAADTELAKLYNETGIDLSLLPAVIMPEELADALRTTVGALAQDRYMSRGVPHVKYGRRVRYLRADVARYLAANRSASLQEH